MIASGGIVKPASCNSRANAYMVSTLTFEPIGGKTAAMVIYTFLRYDNR